MKHRVIGREKGILFEMALNIEYLEHAINNRLDLCIRRYVGSNNKSFFEQAGR